MLPPGLPKPLAQVAGRPFLDWLLGSLARQGIERCILSVGYGAEAIVAHCGARHCNMPIEYCAEEVPLGTGGAIRRALALAREPQVLVLNGDTWLGASYRTMLEAHRAARARLSIACVRVPETGRYGRVVIKDGIVVAFAEKGARGSGVINGGSYVIDRNALSGTPDGAFSFESDYLVPRIAELQPAAFMVEDSFLDIGIPEDLARAQALLPCVAA